MTKRLLQILILVVTATSLYAQQVQQTPYELSDDWKLEQARRDYWRDLLTSGTTEDRATTEMKVYNMFRTMDNRAMFKSLASAAWQPIAGSVSTGHNSGRIVGVAVDPTDNKVVYIAAAGGGIWKCSDITATPPGWMALTDRLPTTNFGAVSVDPNNHLRVFAGSGEPAGDNYQGLNGAGIFRSDDGGLNWTNVCGSDTAGSVCAQILIDQTNSNNIYIATGQTIGILKSTDGGNTWKKVSVGGRSPMSISYSPLAPTYLYAGCINGNPTTSSPPLSGSVWRSTNSGDTWAQATTGLPTASIGRVSIACAPSDPKVVYAGIGSTSNNGTLGVWVSNDSGKTWRVKQQYNPANPASTTNANPLGQQMSFCNNIVVRPTLPSQILVAGLDVYSSSDSGAHLNKVSDWTAGPTSSSYVHADQHCIVFAGSTVYVGSDGGLSSTTTLQQYSSWNNAINEGLATLQVVGTDANKAFSYVMLGCQDNGTLRAGTHESDFTLTHSGDGGHVWVSSDDSNVVYTTYVYTTFFKSLDKGIHFADNLLTCVTGLYRDPLTGTGSGEGAAFYPPYDVSSDGSVVAFAGNSHIWVSSSGGDDCFPVKSNKGVGSANIVHVSQQDPTYMWAGSGSNVWSSADQGVTWTSKSIGGTVTGITSSANDHTKVFAVTNGTGSAKNFYTSTDGGTTFTSPTTQLTGIPCWAVAFSPKDGKLFVGCDKGVLYSEDGGVTWNPLINGFPYARVTGLKVKGSDNNVLLASTYGRGLFWLDLTSLGVSGSQQNSALHLDPVQPNPVNTPEAAVRFTLDKGGYCELRLFDLLGREVKVLDKQYYDAGEHSVRFATQQVTAGTYVVSLISGGSVVSQKVVVE